MKQAGVGPDPVIGLALVKVIEQQRGNRTAETERSLRGHFRRSVGGAGVKPARQHFGGRSPCAAAKFENGGPGRQQGQEAGQPGMLRDLAFGIGRRVVAVKLKRIFIHRLPFPVRRSRLE